MVEGPDYHAIVVAYDGSPGAEAALRRGAYIAAASGASLTLVWAVADDAQERADARDELAAAAAALPDELDTDTWVMATPAATAIFAAVRDIGANLLVTGSRGRGPITAAVLGSVSAELARQAQCDVLIVHPREE